MLKKVFQRFFLNEKIIILLVLGVLTWSVIMVKSGTIYPYGMGFWGPNGHDGVWHIALIKSLVRGSWEMPVFAGENLKNYHIGFDLILATIVRLTGLDPVRLYFQIIPPILALLIGILTYKFVFIWRKSKVQAFWAVFFTYFGGSFGWVVNLLRNGNFSGESMFWSQQAISTLINPPFVLSLVLILVGLIFTLNYIEDLRWRNLFIAVIVLGFLIEVKTYAGILVLLGLFVAAIWTLLFTTSLRSSVVKVLIGSVAVSLVLFLFFNRGAQGLIVFQPFWFLETMMGLTDRVGWIRYFSAMTTYRMGDIWIKAVPAYLIAFAIFWVGNMGTRLVASGWWLVNGAGKRKFLDLSFVDVFIFSIIAAGTLIPMFFLQKGTPWNTIQFFYYSLFFSGVLAGVAIGEFLRESRLKTSILLYSIEVGIVLLTIPTTIGTLPHYLPSRPPAMISKEELSALDFLSKQPNGTILTYPFDRIKAKEAEANPPRSLYLYESTAYVSAFSNKPTFLEDEVNLDITQFEWKDRKKTVESFLNSLNQTEARAFLKNNNITYIYWLKEQRAKLGETQLGIIKIFENNKVDIYLILR